VASPHTPYVITIHRNCEVAAYCNKFAHVCVGHIVPWSIRNMKSFQNYRIANARHNLRTQNDSPIGYSAETMRWCSLTAIRLPYVTVLRRSCAFQEVEKGSVNEYNDGDADKLNGGRMRANLRRTMGDLYENGSVSGQVHPGGDRVCRSCDARRERFERFGPFAVKEWCPNFTKEVRTTTCLL